MTTTVPVPALPLIGASRLARAPGVPHRQGAVLAVPWAVRRPLTAALDHAGDPADVLRTALHTPPAG